MWKLQASPDRRPETTNQDVQAEAPRTSGQVQLEGVGYSDQVQMLAPGADGVEAQQGRLKPGVHDVAQAGVSAGGEKLPHAEAIQASFGRHDVSGVQAHTGSAAARANETLGSTAYATGSAVAFKTAPDLHTAAHEAAHVVQQRAGVQLKGGVGRTGDVYEQHADAVADRVVQGKSAEDTLSSVAGQPGGAQPSLEVQFLQFIGKKLDEELAEGDAKPEHGEDKGQQRRYSVEQYIAMWEEEQGRTLTDVEQKTLARGCIGITAVNLTGGGNPPLDLAYADFDKAKDHATKMNAYLNRLRSIPFLASYAGNKHAVVFAKMFWSNQSPDKEERKKPTPDAYLPDEKTGRVDMSDYKYRSQPGYINFDYAFWDEASQSFWHANHSQPGMKVYQSTREKFAKGYIDFDRVIYCVAVATNYDPGLAAITHVGG